MDKTAVLCWSLINKSQLNASCEKRPFEWVVATGLAQHRSNECCPRTRQAGAQNTEVHEPSPQARRNSPALLGFSPPLPLRIIIPFPPRGVIASCAALAIVKRPGGRDSFEPARVERPATSFTVKVPPSILLLTRAETRHSTPDSPIDPIDPLCWLSPQRKPLSAIITRVHFSAPQKPAPIGTREGFPFPPDYGIAAEAVGATGRSLWFNWYVSLCRRSAAEHLTNDATSNTHVVRASSSRRTSRNIKRHDSTCSHNCGYDNNLFHNTGDTCATSLPDRLRQPKCGRL